MKSGAGFEAGTVCGGTGTAGQGDAHMRERNKWYLVTQGLSIWKGGADVKPKGAENFRTQRSTDRVQTLSRAAMALSHAGESQGKAWARKVA